ncbi:MAG TPA: efflux RND transporter permease subunit, partial [Candidatus Krumholzibacteria bacterium]|nr:efflux RND transporter permease subunit [Candidatus Krumholzibacteria bacterium]
VLTKGGVEVVGGVVVVRYGENPMATIERVKERIASIASGLPTKILPDGTESQVTIVPFYDRSGLIQETLGTLNSAIGQQILITIIVVVLMVGRLRGSLIISSMLPLAVLITFFAMKQFGVDANIVALSGIAIAIGTIVDIGIVLVENVLRALDEADPDEPRLQVVHRAASEVGGAVLTAVATTVVSFLPVFTMEAAEGKLFEPLAWTKTFALIASIALALTLVPAVSHLVLRRRRPRPTASGWRRWIPYLPHVVVVAVVLGVLADAWSPVGPASGWIANAVFIVLVTAVALGAFGLARVVFPPALAWSLDHKIVALLPALALVVLGATIWLGFDRVFGWIPEPVQRTGPAVTLAHAFPGLGSEFMPTLDEGAFLYMPTTMPHASIGEATEILKELDRRILSVPEVKSAVGKIGRVESPLDPAPISMIETVIEYENEFTTNDDGEVVRQWRDEIRSPQDIWDEIVAAAAMPGLTSAPKLQPIETRIVMLQSGFRAPMGVKVFGPDLETIEDFALDLEARLKTVPSVQPAAVFADRVVGKPYLEIEIDRERIARYGIRIADVQEVIEVAIGGKPLTMTVEGRERYPVRVRYQRELRDAPDTLGDILVPTPDGAQVPLRELSRIEYRRGPQMIKSEDTFLVAYVLFDKKPGFAEVTVVEDARDTLEAAIAAGDLEVPAGVSFEFAGSYENQVRAAKRLRVVLPLSLLVIFLLIYLQFRRVSTAAMIFSGVFVAWSGGFLMLWLYGQPWFLDMSLLGVDLRELFQVRTFNLSVAVWVGFLALFGIATDDGVIMATRIRQTLQENRPDSIPAIRAAVVDGGRLRIRAAVMTSATTVLALLPVLTSTGRGSDIMVPMAIPAFGGMVVAAVTWYVVPILYCWFEEFRHRRGTSNA